MSPATGKILRGLPQRSFLPRDWLHFISIPETFLTWVKARSPSSLFGWLVVLNVISLSSGKRKIAGSLYTVQFSPRLKQGDDEERPRVCFMAAVTEI